MASATPTPPAGKIEPDLRTERGLDRLVNFSDAAVAIAITLLILPLVDEAGELQSMTVGEFVGEHVNTVIAFLVSFAVIGRLWMVHHRVFEWVRDYSYPLVWANMLWLASIVFIPFAANALANRSAPDVYALYIGTVIVTSGSMLVIETLLVRHPELLRAEMRGKIDLSHALATILLLLIAAALAVLIPDGGTAGGRYWLLLLFLAGPLGSVLHRLSRRGRLPEPADGGFRTSTSRRRGTGAQRS